ncbi:hypothetical protein [Leucobacter chinensis]|uniref:hypothetical protein n=1 Tax=Leucobacter chinensis TaxID=2851010 RepID=UPI001C222089|nr:hypothetical protein [Leucobacter chinensis]
MTKSRVFSAKHPAFRQASIASVIARNETAASLRKVALKRDSGSSGAAKLEQRRGESTA